MLTRDQQQKAPGARDSAMNVPRFARARPRKTPANPYVLHFRNIRDLVAKVQDHTDTDSLQSTLQFNCVCADGSVPDVSPYIETVPFYVCEETYGQCINAHPNDAEGQRACKAAATCGSKNASAEDTTMSSTTTAASTSLAMATTTGASQTTSSVAAASTTTNAAAALSGLEGYSTGLVAGAMFLAARLFL